MNIEQGMPNDIKKCTVKSLINWTISLLHLFASLPPASAFGVPCSVFNIPKRLSLPLYERKTQSAYGSLPTFARYL